MTTTDLHPDASGLAQLADRFRSSLSLLRARVRVSLVVEGVAFLSLAFALYFVVTLPFDRLFRLEVAVRAVLLIGWLAWVFWYLLRNVLKPIAFELDDDELALAVERSDAHLGQKLISAVQFHRVLSAGRDTKDSPAMMGEVLRDVPAMLESIDVAHAIKGERTRKSWLVLAGSASFLGLSVALFSGFGIWAKRNVLLADVDWPRATRLSVVGAEDGVLVVPRGDDFTVEVDAGGVVPDSLRIEYEFPDGSWGRESMTQNVGEARFTYTFAALLDPVTFYAYGGDGETAEIEVRLVDRPALEALAVELVYPSYMRRDPHAVDKDATEVIIPRGTALRVTGTATKDLEKAELSVGENQAEPAALGADKRTIAGSIVPSGSGLFVVRMLDTDGLSEGTGRALMLRVVPDRAPRLVAKLRGVGAWITSRAQIPVELTATDDFGLQAIKLLWGVGETAAIGSSEELAKTFQEAKAAGLEDFETGAVALERIVRHDLMPLLVNPEEPLDEKNPVQPGKFVAVRFKAWDNNERDGEGQWATSDSYTFKVVTDAELLRELNRRQQELRVQFEKILKKEETDRAEFRELEDPNAPGQLGARVRDRLSHLVRQQRALAKRVLDVGGRYGQILDEMVNNRVTEGVGGEGRVRALRTVIVGGLDQLGTSVMPSVAKLVARYGRQRDAAVRPLADSGYDEAVRKMRVILREMLKLESFTEILTKLKGLIRLQDKTAQQTRARLEKDIEDLLGPGRGRDGRRDPQKPDKK